MSACSPLLDGATCGAMNGAWRGGQGGGCGAGVPWGARERAPSHAHLFTLCNTNCTPNGAAPDLQVTMTSFRVLLLIALVGELAQVDVVWGLCAHPQKSCAWGLGGARMRG